MQQAFIHNYRSLASTQVHLPGRKCRLGLFKLYLYQQPAGPRCRRLCWLRNQTWTWASAMDFCDHQSKTARNDRRRVVAAMMTPLTLGLLGRDEPRWDCAQTLVARIHKCWLPDGWSTSKSCACLKHCKYDCWSILWVSYFSELKMSRHLICTHCSRPNSLALSSCNSGPNFTTFIFWKCAESQMWVCDWCILTHSLRLTVPHLNSETFAHIREAHLLSPIPFNFVKPCRQKL